MCVDVSAITFSVNDLIVWKVVRKDRRSCFGPDNRPEQTGFFGHLVAWLSHPSGRVITYPKGATRCSRWPGIYCFSRLKHAKREIAWLASRGGHSYKIIKLSVPAGAGFAHATMSRQFQNNDPSSCDPSPYWATTTDSNPLGSVEWLDVICARKVEVLT